MRFASMIKQQVPYMEQILKFQNYLKKRAIPKGFDYVLDSYAEEDLKGLGEYGCMLVLLTLKADFMSEKISEDKYMISTATEAGKLDEFKAFLSKIKRKKTIFSNKLRLRRRYIRSNDPLSTTSKYNLNSSKGYQLKVDLRDPNKGKV